MSEPVNLWEYLELMAIAAGRGQIKSRPFAIATLVALNGSGATGKDCPVDDERLSAELGISTSTVWRSVSWLVANGWLERTKNSSRGHKGQPGRKARYRICRPVIDLGITLPEPSNHVAPPSVAMRNENGRVTSQEDAWA